MTQVILIASANDDLALRALQCLKLAGLNAFIALPRAGNSVCRLSRACRGAFELPQNLTETDGVPFFRALCSRLKVTHIIPADISQTLLLAAIRQQLAPTVVFPTPDAESIRELDNKLAFARLLQRLNLPGPRYCLLRTPADVHSHPLGHSVVIKPLHCEGGRGVRRCQTQDELKTAVAVAPDIAAHPLLLHEYIPGEDIDLSLLADHGEIVAWTIHGRSSRSLGYALGSVRFLDNEEMLRLGCEFVRAIRYHGVAHIDMRLDSRDGSIKFIEFNPRFFGSIHFAAFAGVNFVALGLDLSSGKLPSPAPHQINGAANSPLAFFRLLFRNPENISRFTPATRCALRLAILDPLPWVASRLRRRVDQMPVSL